MRVSNETGVAKNGAEMQTYFLPINDYSHLGNDRIGTQLQLICNRIRTFDWQRFR